MAVYWVGVANQSELNTSPCKLTSDIAGKKMKNTQRESWKTTYLKIVNAICTNSNICIIFTKIDTGHIITKNLAENAVQS